mmetsp:Transcript_21869/g.32735  ORF Transcript_21869/g.32735 Transcript_21869/m.32735 type:complete len:317 (-) Transcript_21869:160-1110(-)
MLGPITILKAKAAICPCLLTPQESSASQALSAIGSLPIQYYVGNTDTNSNGSGNGVGRFVSNLFRGAANAAAAASGDVAVAGYYKKGKLYVIDSLRGPILLFETENEGEIGDDKNDHHDGGDTDDNDDSGIGGGINFMKKNNIKKKDQDMKITVKKIGEVAVYDSFLSSSSGNAGIAIYKKKKRVGGGGNTDQQQNKAELIRFNVLSSNPFNHGDDVVVSSDERDDVIDNLRIIVDWDCQRRKKNPNEAADEDEEDDDDDDESKKTGIALKAKYFVQREIEMKKQKKDREERKARYLKDSGGLKYTALAMANREMT